jgi:hypothetical protein
MDAHVRTLPAEQVAAHLPRFPHSRKFEKLFHPRLERLMIILFLGVVKLVEVVTLG